MLARSVGELRNEDREDVPPELHLVQRHPEAWADLRYALDDGSLYNRYAEEIIAHNLVEELGHRSH